ncbi:MAG: LysM peptidoglycan-binding domain-containing protein [Planctomycetes bacterium]|nr:LysM peptidoglycan-binding domain-containing protein [Planctomycetota bacterium]
MKQNERLLVYAVSGFLGLILVVAVLFRPSGDNKRAAQTPGLAQILNQEVAAKDADASKSAAAPAADGAAKAADAAFPGVPSPTEVAPQPLAAPAPKPMVAADLVAQQLGLSRRERNVRFVRAKPNDSLDSLVCRWCGARDPYLAETKSLNEDLVVLRVGQEVAVPWVDDEVLLLAIEASKPKALTAEAPSASAPAAAPAAAPVTNVPMPTFAPAGTVAPGTLAPGNGSANSSGALGATGALASGSATPAVGGTSYTVKPGDSLWRIAERTYGRKNADKMVAAIKQANPGLGDNVRDGQKIVLPAK